MPRLPVLRQHQRLQLSEFMHSDVGGVRTSESNMSHDEGGAAQSRSPRVVVGPELERAA